MSRNCARQLRVYSNYSYTLETIIQAGQRNIAIMSVPVRTNPDLRPSRLMTSVPDYIKRSIITIVRIFVVYQPFKFFMSVAAALGAMGLILGFRFVYFVFVGEGDGHVQSVVLSGALLAMAVQTGLIAFVADLLSVNRRLLEELSVESPGFGISRALNNSKDAE